MAVVLAHRVAALRSDQGETELGEGGRQGGLFGELQTLLPKSGWMIGGGNRFVRFAMAT